MLPAPAGVRHVKKRMSLSLLARADPTDSRALPIVSVTPTTGLKDSEKNKWQGSSMKEIERKREDPALMGLKRCAGAGGIVPKYDE